LFAELQPVKLKHCDLRRFGEANDGGYLMCANLLGTNRAAYSYGIAGYDGWGCQMSSRFAISVHQYDCFDTKLPACPGAHADFHPECVGPERKTTDGRLFDTVENQIARNKDAGKDVVVKMDIEGAEWATLLATPDAVLNHFTQLAMEFHGTDEARFLAVVRKLKTIFHMVHLHFNNYACKPGLTPFPAHAYQVLFVNKRLAEVDPEARATLPHPEDAPDDPRGRDCQLGAWAW
jgi:hypothetical protein